VKGKQIGVEKRGTLLLSAGIPFLLLIYIFTPQKPIQFITLFFILLVLGSKAYSEYLVRHLIIIHRDRELRAFRYEWTEVEFWLENTGKLPAFLLVLVDSPGAIAVFRNNKFLCTLVGKSRQLFRWEAYGSDRGVFSLGPASLRGSDPLGLFPFVMVFEETIRFFVYPAPAYASLKSPGGIPLGNLITTDPFNEDLTRPRSLREYSPGDDSRRINWKASAKISSPLLVNEYELSLTYPLVLFLNVDIREYAIKRRELYIERVIEAAAALCLMAARERQTLGLIIHTAGNDPEDKSATNAGAINAAAFTATAFNADVISPAAFTLIPVLERLAALDPFARAESMTASDQGTNGLPALRHSTERLLEKGKTLPFGTRLVYTGPVLGDEDYQALDTLRRRRLTLEYFIIDEKALGNEFNRGSRRASRNAVPKYQIKERGYEIL